jgi:hypothetical protein
MPRFILHVGAHKTGTTAFQLWAWSHREQLEDAGYLYPRHGASPAGNHARLSAALAGLDEVDPDTAARMVEGLTEDMAAAPELDVLVSAEGMSRFKYLRHLPTLRAHIRRHGYGALVLMAVREQVAWRNSCYAQMRETLVPLPPFAEFMPDARSGNWEWMEDRYRKAGFAFRALAFDAAFRRAGAAAAMVQAPGLRRLRGLPGLRPQDRRESNPTLNAHQLLACEVVRETLAGPGAAVPPVVRRRIQPLLLRTIRDLPGPRFNGFTPEAAAAMTAQMAESNDRFALKHFERPWAELFPAPEPADVTPSRVEELDAPTRAMVEDAAARTLAEARATGLL